MSLPALVKRIPVEVRGVYFREATDDAIRAARIILVGMHWFPNIGGAARLVQRVKQLNPHSIIIAGGITASLYSYNLVNELGFDYVVRGDAEIPLPRLVMELLDGGDPEKVPNLVGRNGLETPWSYVLTQEDLNENEYLDLDFFPALREEIQQFHSNDPPWPIGVHPWLVPFRGCPIDCSICVGSLTEQKKHFRRGPVIRSADIVSDDLSRMNENGMYRFVNSYHDFITLLPESYSQKVLRKPTRLRVYQEFAALPSKEALDLFLSRFQGGIVMFSMDNMHTTSIEPVDPALLISRIQMAQKIPGYTATLFFNGTYSAKDRNYQKAVYSVLKSTKCHLFNASLCWPNFPKPDESGKANPSTFESFLHLSWRQRYPILKLNTIARTGRFIESFLPASWITWLGRTRFRLFHNAPFLIRWYLLSRRHSKYLQARNHKSEFEIESSFLNKNQRPPPARRWYEEGP